MQEPDANKDAECERSYLAFGSIFVTRFFSFCANLKRELGDTSVENAAPAADLQTPQPMEVGGLILHRCMISLLNVQYLEVPSKHGQNLGKLRLLHALRSCTS